MIVTYYPVIIPTLNRYKHLKACVESLAVNTHAEQTELVIGVDYPPSEEYVEGWKKIKEYVHTIHGFKKTTIFEYKENYGAVKNSKALVEYVFSQYDAYIFTEDDNVFSTMKAIIEGSLIQCPKNAVIYATSNRRHWIRESFQSRSGDEVHLKDTINEVNSLAERFGINLFFEKPTSEEFNQIVLELAKDNNIEIDEKTLIEKAQRLALIKGTRSPRIAKQLIDNLIAHVDI